MARIISRITIIRSKYAPTSDLNEELQWLGNALGLFTERDREKSCFRIFIELLRAAKHHEALTSDDIANRLNLARGTVVHHLNRLMEANLVSPTRKAYGLRHERLERVIEEVEEDAMEAFRQLKALAKVIDRRLE